MNSKNLTAAARAHMGRVKEQACSVCDAPGPSQAHHIKQGLHFCTVAVCVDCHGSWHGTKALWRVRKMDELDALDVTLWRLARG